MSDEILRAPSGHESARAFERVHLSGHGFQVKALDRLRVERGFALDRLRVERGFANPATCGACRIASDTMY